MKAPCERQKRDDAAKRPITFVFNGGPGAADSASQDAPNNVTSVSFGSTTVTVPAVSLLT